MLLTQDQNEAKTIGLRIAMKRQALGMTQENLAEYSGLSANTVYSIESGRYEAKASSICKIASALQCSTDSLLFGESPEIENESNRLLRTLSFQALQKLNDNQLMFFVYQIQSLLNNIIAYL